MKYYLDSNILIYYLNNRNQNVIDKMNSIPMKDMKIPSMVAAELLHGAYRGRSEHKISSLKTFLSKIEIVPFDEGASMLYGRHRAALEAEGNMIGPKDMIIAATVLSRGGVLVTNNTKEFVRVKGLQIENWSTWV